MSKSPPLRLLPPSSSRRWPWFAVTASVLVHALLLLVRVGAHLPARPKQPEVVILIPLGTQGPRAVEMAFRPPSAGGAPRAPPRSGIMVQPRPETGPPPEPTPPPDTVVARAEPPAGDTAGPAPAVPGARRARIGPALGDGKLWVPPLPLPPRELAAALSRTHIELVDSAVTAIVQAYIDSVLAAPSAAGAGPPAWTAKIGGQTIGLDAKYIYLGPIKLPTFLLALLPLGNTGAYNLDMTKAYQFQLMREDLQLAAQRSQTMEDFKRAIRELREQREREREFAKNQRTPPKPKPKAKADTTVAKSPTP